MKNQMKALVSNGYYRGELTSVPVPDISPNSVLVKVCYCGICGTDQDLFSSECSFAENGQITYPARLGHEWSGIVEDVGSNVTEFKKGDKVVGDNAVCCGECEACKSGDYAQCTHLLNVGTIDPAYPGSFAEYYVVPKWHVHKIPQYLSLKEASLAEPFSVAYGGIKRMNITNESVVAVIGTGCIGMAAVVLSKLLGAKKVIMFGLNSEKLKIAKTLGAETLNTKACDVRTEIDKYTDGKGADFVFECSGAANTFNQAISIAGHKATIALIGFYANKENNVNIDTIVSKALTLFGVMGAIGDMAGVLEILDKHPVNLLPIITEEIPFEDCLKGFVRKNYKNAIKLTVKINEE